MYMSRLLLACCLCIVSVADECSGDWSCSARESADKDMSALLQGRVGVVHADEKDDPSAAEVEEKEEAEKEAEEEATSEQTRETDEVVVETSEEAAAADDKTEKVNEVSAEETLEQSSAGVEKPQPVNAHVSTADASEGTASARAAADASTAAGVGSASPSKARPSLTSQKTDMVTFGILLKKWYGIAENKGEASVDAVITLHWKDPRVTHLIPAGSTSLTLAGKAARSKIWMPDVVATNVAHGGRDIISSSVKIHSDGSVTQVDRELLNVKQSIATKDFPFDSQSVQVKLASSTYMQDEVALVPIKQASEWGAPSDTNIFSNSVWYFKGNSLTSYNEVDGELQKSRGVLTLVVKRGLAEFISSVFMPSAVFLFVTWSAFWLPLGGPYSMPRIALNAFALLCQVSVSQMAEHKIPDTGDRAWMTEYLGLCIQLQFALALINVLIITIEHKSDGHTLALMLNDRMIMSYPVTTTTNIVLLGAGHVMMSRLCVAATLVSYLCYVSLSYKWHHEDKEALRDSMKHEAQ